MYKFKMTRTSQLLREYGALEDDEPDLDTTLPFDVGQPVRRQEPERKPEPNKLSLKQKVGLLSGAGILGFVLGWIFTGSKDK